MIDIYFDKLRRHETRGSSSLMQTNRKGLTRLLKIHAKLRRTAVRWKRELPTKKERKKKEEGKKRFVCV